MSLGGIMAHKNEIAGFVRFGSITGE